MRPCGVGGACCCHPRGRGSAPRAARPRAPGVTPCPGLGGPGSRPSLRPPRQKPVGVTLPLAPLWLPAGTGAASMETFQPGAPRVSEERPWRDATPHQPVQPSQEEAAVEAPAVMETRLSRHRTGPARGPQTGGTGRVGCRRGAPPGPGPQGGRGAPQPPGWAAAANGSAATGDSASAVITSEAGSGPGTRGRDSAHGAPSPGISGAAEPRGRSHGQELHPPEPAPRL